MGEMWTFFGGAKFSRIIAPMNDIPSTDPLQVLPMAPEEAK